MWHITSGLDNEVCPLVISNLETFYKCKFTISSNWADIAKFKVDNGNLIDVISVAEIRDAFIVFVKDMAAGPDDLMLNKVRRIDI